MAGGYGERLWPLSRSTRPKQLLKLLDDGSSLLGTAVRRIEPLIPHESIHVVTSRSLQQIVRQGLPDLPAENVMAEPHKRNTSACLALILAKCMARDPGHVNDTTLAVLTADHLIETEEQFRKTVSVALQIAESEDRLVTIGVYPTRPETAYGYIEVADKSYDEAKPHASIPVARFREKPNRQVAEDFISTGNFFWNSGMFFGRLPVFLDELDEAMPTLAMATREMADCFRKGDEAAMSRLDRVFEGLADISIDFGLMEKSQKITMIPAQFKWDDLGAWDALERVYPKDRDGNVTEGDPILIDTHDCLVYNAEGSSRFAVAALGLRGLTIVGTEDAVLVCPTERAQDIRKIVRLLKERHPRFV